jgi:nucleotide-binding universal stress UspA family protein
MKGGDNSMKNYRKVLIAVNGSMDVLTKGLRLAEEEKCQVTVVKVVPSYDGDLSLVGVKNIKDVLDGDTEKAISAIEELAKAEGATVKVRVENGDIDKKIAEVAEEERSDLIIMGANRQSTLKDLILGNLVGKVTSQTDRPVFLVKS